MAERLRKIRKDAKLTQLELANRAHVGLATIRRIEAGSNASVSVLRKISRAIGCPLSALIPDDEKKEGESA